MIVIKIELWPKGDPKRAVRLSEGYIWNDGSGTAAVGNYKFRLFRVSRTAVGEAPNNPATWKLGEFKGHPRGRKSVWHLLLSVLKTAIEGDV